MPKRPTRRTSATGPARTARATSQKRSTSLKRTGVSVHLGLNSVDAKHYAGWSGELMACEFDARDMAALAKQAGLTSTVLLTKQATRKNALGAIRAAAKTLKAGDFFFLTYSGHGGQVDDVSGEEADKLDETWCLFDGELIDDELYMELSRFAKGVRVLVLSDSCHSGTVTRAAPPRISTGAGGVVAGRPKMMPPAVARRVYELHQEFYDRLQQDVQREARARAAVEPSTSAPAASVGPSTPSVPPLKNMAPGASVDSSGTKASANS